MFIRNRNMNFIGLKHINQGFRNYYDINLNVSPNIVKTPSEKIEQKRLLQEYLGITYQRSVLLIRNHTFLQTMDNLRLEKTLISLKQYGFENVDIYKNPVVLSFHSNTIEHNVLYLQEAGFTQITANYLLRFRSTLKKPVNLLKAHGIISENMDVPQRLYSYLNPKPEEFPLLKSINDEQTFVHMHEIIFKKYLVWRLNTSEEKINKIFKTYDKFKYKSFKLMSNMIKLLTEELEFKEDKILQHSYLFQVSPQYPQQIMSTFPTLAGVDIKTILYKYPKIMTAPVENIKQVYNHLMTFEICDESIRKNLDIFTLNPSTVLFRLNELKKVPEFKVLVKNVRIVRLLVSQNKAKLRLEYLRQKKVKCASIHLLCTAENIFDKYVFEGNDRTRGCDIINYIKSELCVSKDMTLNLRKLFHKNVHWYHVPIISVRNTLNYLLQKNFSKEDILKYVNILLYPRYKIMNALDEIQKHPEIDHKNISRENMLNLCLYFIEKQYHFSGDGMWDNGTMGESINTTVKDDDDDDDATPNVQQAAAQ